MVNCYPLIIQFTEHRKNRFRDYDKFYSYVSSYTWEVTVIVECWDIPVGSIQNSCLVPVGYFVV